MYILSNLIYKISDKKVMETATKPSGTLDDSSALLIDTNSNWDTSTI